MRVLHVELDGEMKIMTTTDGRRLHQLTIPADDLNIEAGDYTVIKKSNIITLALAGPVNFPDWRRVIPEKTVDLYGEMPIDKKAMEEPVYLLNRLGIMINYKYLSALDGFTWNVGQDARDRRSAVIFESGALKAVIMPFVNDEVCHETEIAAAEMRLNALKNPAEPEKPVKPNGYRTG
jgi:hypothetical protein